MTREERKIYFLEYTRSKKGLISDLYGAQKSSSKRRGHNKPTYNLQELREWCFSQEIFHILYDNWKRLDFQRGYRPSLDRIDDRLGYTMANIQLMTWDENNKKGNLSKRLLKDEDIIKIRKSSKSMRALGKEYGVSGNTIKNIITKKIYK